MTSARAGGSTDREPGDAVRGTRVARLAQRQPVQQRDEHERADVGDDQQRDVGVAEHDRAEPAPEQREQREEAARLAAAAP